MRGKRKLLAAFGFLFLAAAVSQLAVPEVFAEGKRKGPEVEEVPDLEEVIRPDTPAPRSAGPRVPDPDAESLSDLEKVIEMEDSKTPATVAKNPTALRSATPQKAPPPPPSRNAAPSDDRALEELREVTAAEETDGGALSLEAEDQPRRAAAAADPAVPQIDDESRRPEPRPEPRRQVALPPSNVRNAITNLEFKMEGAGSRLVVTARAPLRYREVRNSGMRQVVYFFENTETPERLQRAYDTTEFTSAVSLFTLLQVPGETPPSSKLIVQLREDKEPAVLATERGLYIDFGPPSPGSIQPRVASGSGQNGGTSKVLIDGDIYLGNQEFSGRRIKRLEIKNTEVSDVLRLIAKTSGYNLVVGDDVIGKVNTLSLENVPWDQAFALVLQSKKLGYVLSGNVIRVATLGSLKTEKDEVLASEQAKIKIEPLRTVLIPVSFAAAKDLEQQAKPFLTPRGSVSTDARTNTVIVKDIEKVVTRVQKLMAALDTAPPRVAISARFVEMTKRFERSINSILTLATDFSGLNIGATSSFGGSGQNLSLSAAQFANLTARFDLREGEGNVRTLANPSVTVVANQRASVSQAFSFFVPAADTSAVGVIAVPTLKQVTTTLQLDVTPIVAGDGSIFMNLAIKNEIPNPNGAQTTIDSRNVATQVLIDNGDTAVVGGIFSNTYTKSETGIPILRSIPVLGTLFTARSENMSRSEIFIFITAKITNAEDSFRRNL